MRRSFRRGIAGNFLVLKPRNGDMDVDPVDERPGYFFQIAADFARGAVALLGRIAVKAARTSVQITIQV